MSDHGYFSNLIWQIADLLRGPYRPPQYERVMLLMTVLRRFDCVLAPTKPQVLAEFERLGGRLDGRALDARLSRTARQNFHNHSPLDFKKLRGDPDRMAEHLVSYINGFSENVRRIFEHFEFEAEIEKMQEAGILASAVTQGLDPGVPLRDSGIPWIEQVPTHWDIWKLGHAATVGNGSTPNRGRSDYWSETGTPWLNSSVVHLDEAVKSEQFVTDLALRECHLPIVDAGSVLVAITGQGNTRGKTTLLAINATINQHLAYLTPDAERLDPRYLRWIIFAAYEYLRNISDDTGGTKGALTCEDLSNLRVPIPPINEQRAIAVHIATEFKHLAELHEVIVHMTRLLQERRSTLIAATIAGQIEVGKGAEADTIRFLRTEA